MAGCHSATGLQGREHSATPLGDDQQRQDWLVGSVGNSGYATYTLSLVVFGSLPLISMKNKKMTESKAQRNTLWRVQFGGVGQQD